MRTLLIEPTPADPMVAEALAGAGHEVVRCHEPGAASFPCAALEGDGCPLEVGAPIDVAVAMPDRDVPEVADGGATCALRSGVPLVLVGARSDDPLSSWAEPCSSLSEVGAAADRAIAATARRRAAPLRAEVERLLASLDVDAGAVEVEVVRRGDTADVTVRTQQPLDPRLAGAVAARVHAIDGTGSWPTSKLTVALSSPSSADA